MTAKIPDFWPLESLFEFIVKERRDIQYKLIKRVLDNWNANDRAKLLYEYCRSCGDENPRCQCWNDE